MWSDPIYRTGTLVLGPKKYVTYRALVLLWNYTPRTVWILN